MNLYFPDIIKNGFRFNIATYNINRHTHEETLSSIYVDKNTQKNSSTCFIQKQLPTPT